MAMAVRQLAKQSIEAGDIIFAVNGQSTEEFTHEELVSKIKTCKNSMRMVLVNANICQKIELHQRRQKLQALLRQKQSELKGLEKREAALFYNARARQRQMELRLRADADKEAAQTMTNQSCSASSHPQQMGDGDRHAATTTNSANTPANGSLDVRPKTTIGSRKQDIGHNVIGQTTDSRDHQHTRGNKPH